MRGYQRRYSILLLVSLMLHFLLYLILIMLPKEQSRKESDQSFQVTLREIPVKDKTPIEETLLQELLEENLKDAAKPKEMIQENTEEDTELSPIDNADEISTNNQDETIKGEVIGGGQISEEKEPETTKKMSVEKYLDSHTSLVDQVDVVELQKPEMQISSEAILKEEQKPEILTSKNKNEFEQAKEFIPSYLDPIENDIKETPKQGQNDPAHIEVIAGLKEELGKSLQATEEESAIDLDVLGNIFMLPDQQLSEVTVPQPFSKKKSKELRLVNKYLKRMNEQVMAYWINPYKGNQILLGIIQIELNASGYLVNSYVYRESGDKILDISVLDAIRAVRRYEVPDSKLVERYYQNLKFHYSSIKQQVELMPFEIELSRKQEN